MVCFNWNFETAKKSGFTAKQGYLRRGDNALNKIIMPCAAAASEASQFQPGLPVLYIIISIQMIKIMQNLKNSSIGF
jgi:hypothetical protein